MEVKIADTFVKSLKRLIMKESWWYKTYSILRWELWIFLSNIWKFRKELWQFRWWDYHFTLQMMRRSFTIMERGMHAGLEVRESRDKKIKQMGRLIELLDNKIEDRYVELAEKELGYEIVFKGFEFEEVDKLNSNGEKLYQMVDNETDEEKKLNKAIYDRSREIEEEQWKEIWIILEGQNVSDYSNQMLDVIQPKETETNGEKDWNDWFDGTGLRGWWD